MSYRLLLDENVEYELIDGLGDHGFDVEHVAFATRLGKSSDDEAIASFSKETNRLVVTHDDDFVKEFEDGDVHGVLYLPETSLRTDEIVEIVSEISQYYPQSKIDGVVYAGRNWL